MQVFNMFEKYHKEGRAKKEWTNEFLMMSNYPIIQLQVLCAVSMLAFIVMLRTNKPLLGNR